MNRYELTYIINTTLEETARKELIDKFTELIKQNGGEIEKVDESWGKRRLAYPIDDMPEGYYVLTTFQASGSQNKEIQRNLEINDMILRYLIIKLLDKKQSVKPKPIRPAAIPVKEEAQPAQPIREPVKAPVEAKPETVRKPAVSTPEAPAQPKTEAKRDEAEKKPAEPEKKAAAEPEAPAEPKTESEQEAAEKPAKSEPKAAVKPKKAKQEPTEETATEQKPDAEKAEDTKEETAEKTE